MVFVGGVDNIDARLHYLLFALHLLDVEYSQRIRVAALFFPSCFLLMLPPTQETAGKKRLANFPNI